MDKKTIKNYAYNLAYQVLVLIAPLVTTPYVSRVLHSDGIGDYSYTFTIATAFSLFAALGVNSYGQREIAYRQDDLEAYFAEQTNLVTFTIAPRAANGYSFAWLGVLNFWGSEGDQMADVTTVAETDSDGTKSIWYLANLDRSRFIPDTSGTATSFANFTDNYGYERLSYYWAYTGLSGTFYRGKDTKADYAAFNLVATTPTAAGDAFAVNLNSSAYDGVYAPSSYPAVPASGSQFSYWMCSLSFTRYYALGPWYVISSGGPSTSSANYWGGRASLNILAAEGEARSGAD